jgi:hypothetical protein
MPKIFLLMICWLSALQILAQRPLILESDCFSEVIAKGNLPKAKRIIIKKSIVCDVDFQFKKGTEIELGPGVQLIVKSGRKLVLDSCFLYGKTKLWQGILVEKGAVLKVNNSSIKDALYAIELQNNAFVFIDNTTLAYNYASVYTAPQASAQTAVLQITKTTFAGGALLPSNNTTVGIGNWSYAGILLNDFAALTMQGGGNQFSDLANGIVAYRSNLRLEKDARF